MLKLIRHWSTVHLFRLLWVCSPHNIKDLRPFLSYSVKLSHLSSHKSFLPLSVYFRNSLFKLEYLFFPLVCFSLSAFFLHPSFYYRVRDPWLFLLSYRFLEARYIFGSNFVIAYLKLTLSMRCQYFRHHLLYYLANTSSITFQTLFFCYSSLSSTIFSVFYFLVAFSTSA